MVWNALGAQGRERRHWATGPGPFNLQPLLSSLEALVPGVGPSNMAGPLNTRARTCNEHSPHHSGLANSSTASWTPPESRSLETSVVNEKARSSQASTPRSSSPVSHSRHPVSPGLCPRSSPGNGRLTTWARPLMHPPPIPRAPPGREMPYPKHLRGFKGPAIGGHTLHQAVHHRPPGPQRSSLEQCLDAGPTLHVSLHRLLEASDWHTTAARLQA